MVLGHMVLCTHVCSTHGIACNGAYKRLEIIHCNVGLEVSAKGSLGQIGQGFGQCLMKFHWLGFSPEFGVFPIKYLCYVYDLLLVIFHDYYSSR